jgi:tRNA U34 2-thiouridine synthase MnmA/TrmU
MLNIAGDYMREIGADFLITGEVLGQRPKSQKITGLNTVENASGYKGYILRPLCAKLLPPTIPEEKGLVNRDLLLDISGRSRHRQMALAEEYDLRDYPSPAGGCKLTEPGFSIRLRKFFKYNSKAVPDDIKYLKLGRHIVFDNAWLIIGRDKAENELLRTMHSEKDYLIESNSHFGPDALLHVLNPVTENPALISQAAALTAYYGKGKEALEVIMNITKPNQDKFQLTVKPDNFGMLPLQ